MKKTLTVAAVAGAAAFMALGPTASAQEASFRVPGFVEGEPGTTVLLVEVAVPDELVGERCELSDIVLNNASVHLGNDLIVTTGSSVAVFDNYEDAPFKVTEASGLVELGTTIRFELRFGPDGITSKGHTFDVNCSEPPPTTTTTTAPTTTAPTTTAPTTTAPTTTAPPPPAETTTTAPAPLGPTTSTTAPTTSTTAPPTIPTAPVPPAIEGQPPLAG